MSPYRPDRPSTLLSRLRRVACLLACGLLLPLAAVAQDVHYDWQSVRIGGGGYVSGLVFHPAEKGLYYARTDVGGAYRWDDAAKKWISLTDWLGADDARFQCALYSNQLTSGHRNC